MLTQSMQPVLDRSTSDIVIKQADAVEIAFRENVSDFRFAIRSLTKPKKPDAIRDNARVVPIIPIVKTSRPYETDRY